jgi:cyclopropane fatty-acyl-phospholipid synthase-like methyltransferase
MMIHTAAGILVIFLHVILYVYLFYTIVAHFKGAAFLPTGKKNVERMLELAKVGEGDLLLDVGSGDGRILFAGAARGARCVGIEINPLLVWYSRAVARLKGAAVTVKRADLWAADFSSVDVLTVYLVPQFLGKLEKKIKAEMKPGSRVVAAVYHFPDWVPAGREENVCLYIV